MDPLGFALVALTILGFGLLSGRLQGTVVSAPMIFTAAGLMLGPAVLGWVAFDLGRESTHLLAELTLVVVLFTDASRIDVKRLRREHNLPLRMLLYGLPLTIVLGALTAFLLLGLSLLEAAVLAAILAPTDAALGQAVVSDPRVPVRVRQALNVESGLNDGVALPAILILICAASAAHELGPASDWIEFVGLQVTLGPLAGVLVGVAGGLLVARGAASGWMNSTFEQLSSIALALLAFALAEAIGGNGFIAAFVGGLALSRAAPKVVEAVHEFAEAEGQLLSLLTFMLFGAVMVPIALEVLTLQIVVYAVLSLTFVRLVPVAISLLGAGVRPQTVLFLGWFGPRGIASILFALLLFEDTSIPGLRLILGTVFATVLLSVLAHGVTAAPAVRWYGRLSASMADEPDVVEHEPVSEMPVRLPYRSRPHGPAGR